MGTKRDRISNFEVQRPVNWDEKAVQKILDRAGYVYVDIKYDGIRGVLFYDTTTGSYRIVTRENIEIVSISERVDNLCNTHRLPVTDVYDCEVVIPDIPFDKASGLLRRFEPLKDCSLELRVFDVIDTTVNMAARSLFISRKPDISHDGVSLGPVKRRKAESLEDIHALFADACASGYEGLVVKDPHQKYTGSKVRGWFKLKPKETQDGVVVEFVWGAEGKANTGKIVGFVVQLEDGTTCNATGITQDLMEQVTIKPAAYMGRYVEIERMESTGEGNSRHPHFKCFRDLESAKGIKS